MTGKEVEKHLKVWFWNGGPLLELTILIPDNFWPPSCFGHLKSGHNIWFSYGYLKNVLFCPVGQF
jgi:hypothetical protein